jgi:FtsZ-interacting cell division protein ZipA
MSSLQIGLAIAGGIVLAGVVAHSTWTSRKNKPRQAEPTPLTDGSAEGSVSANTQGSTDPSWGAEPQTTAYGQSYGNTEPTIDHSHSTSSVSTIEPSFDAAASLSDSKYTSSSVSASSSASDNTTALSHDPVSDMARAMMQEATQHAQRVPTEEELAKLHADRERAAQRAAQEIADAKLAAARANQHMPAAPSAMLNPMIAKVMDGSAAELLQPEKRPTLDALIDVIAPVEIDLPISGEAAIASMPPTRRVGSKLFNVEGLNTETGLWETPRHGQRYSAFQTGVQLANRTGALNEIEYSEFVLKTQTFADAINGAPEFPDMIEEVSRARELDSFASAHDAQLSFTLKATKASWSPGYVHQNAARLGFVPGVIPGRMVVPANEVGLPAILGLTFDSQAAMSEDMAQSAIREITLSLDVPQVDRREEPFARLIQSAHELARVMDGVVTDDNGQPLAEAAIGAIARDLQALYNTLDARDLSAGSPQARRLFS